MKKLTLAILVLLSLILIPFLLPATSFCEKLLKEAMYYEKWDNKVVHCLLCPRKCVIPDKQRGFCGVRENRKGTLYTLVYAEAVAVHIDPIEKKPLFHVLPGADAFSIATVGCNLRCKFCQNWQISQAKPGEVKSVYLTPQEVVEKARQAGSPVIAYTYSEPTIFFEYMLETAKLARQAGIKNVMHSAGFINPEPLKEICKYLDAANIDLKGFSQKYYQEICLGNLDNVLESLKIIKQAGVHLEITSLLVTGLNDQPEDIKSMCLWIKENLGADVPVHFSRFWPLYKLINLSPTPLETLEKARQIAMDAGLKYVYLGNIPGNPAENTYCPRCHKLIIQRSGYTILGIHIDKQGRCQYCKEKIEGIWQ
ncbi:MAG: AmmeMemoRadiSam system radical SAM enzyme [Candidatus Omnitrophota bacterium]|nr:AmmeMemoRadiSam system radical SAM enzyme [Candidatus Omnitrophota bacterium]